MHARGVTNLLLAVIAGVLLFGREAMVGGILWIVVLGVAIAVLFGLLMGASYLLRELISSYREAETWNEVAMMTFGFAVLVFAVPLMGYAGLLWLDGVDRPLNAAMDSSLGQVWGYVFFGFAGLAAVAVLVKLALWLKSHVRELPRYALMCGRWLVTAALAPVIFPVREWRFRREEGAGIAVRVMSSAYAVLLGLALLLAVVTVALMIAISTGLVG